jgi:hypothetical protein
VTQPAAGIPASLRLHYWATLIRTGIVVVALGSAVALAWPANSLGSEWAAHRDVSGTTARAKTQRATLPCGAVRASHSTVAARAPTTPFVVAIYNYDQAAPNAQSAPVSAPGSLLPTARTPTTRVRQPGYGALAIFLAAEDGLPDLTLDSAQLEAKFKHAADFGITEPRGAAGFEAYGNAVDSFVSDSSTVRIEGTYRGNAAILNYDPQSRLVVIQEPSGEFVSGWRMSPAQLHYVVTKGSLGGG